MKNVHILSPDIVSKIAAGEVIDRPASVLKELIENSLDAGATHIEVQLKDAGKTSILLKDNGDGIEQDDLETIFKRHATSKITSADDLFDIHSLGFRGEALYSIAAVSDLLLRSKTADQDVAWAIHMRGGEKLNLAPCSFGNHGTEIEIKELFFNTPARKKFLKTNTSEIYQILNLLVPYTLIYPQCRFKVTHQGKDLIDLAPTDNPLSRIAHSLNIKETFLLETEYDSKETNTQFRLVLGDINIKRARRDMQYIFVNGRPVFNKNISFHMNKIFRLILPPDVFPFFAIFLSVPAEEIDVNIHPTKREVKIKNENEICRVLRSVSEDLLMKSGATKKVGESPSMFEMPSSVDQALRSSHIRDRDQQSVEADFSSAPTDITPRREYAYPRGESITQSSEQQPGLAIPHPDFYKENIESLRHKLESARFIGNFINKYLIFEYTNSLLLIDQHAAAERITYEKLIHQMEKGRIEIQPLLSPIILNVSPQEFAIWEESQENLDAIGFATTQWDEHAIAIHSHPNLLKDAETAVRHLLVGESIDTTNHDSLARRACRSSIMTGDTLQPEKVNFIKEELLNCLDPYTCPHGRPTVIELSEDFLDKQFLRT